MPAIPTVTAPELTPPPQISPGIAGAPGQAMARAGEQLGAAAEYGEQVADRIAKAQDDGLMLAAENQIDADVEKAHAQLANWTDYTHADDLKQQTADDMLRKYGDQYSDKPYLWRYIQPYLAKELNAYNSNVDVKRSQLISSFNKGALDENLTRLSNQAASATSPEERDRTWAEADGKIDAMAANGSITFAEAAAKKIGLRASTELAEIRQALNPLNPPEAMEAELEKIKQHPEAFKEIPPTELATLQDRLGTAYREAQERSDTREVRGKVNLAAGRLQAVHGDDYAQMLEAIKDPKTQQTLGLTDKNGQPDTQTINELRTYLGGQDAIDKKTEADANQAALDKFSTNADDLKMTDQQIDDGALLWKTNPKDPNSIPPHAAEQLKERRRTAIRFNQEEERMGWSEARQKREDANAETVAGLLAPGTGLYRKEDLEPLVAQGKLSNAGMTLVLKTQGTAADPNVRQAVSTIQQSGLFGGAQPSWFARVFMGQKQPSAPTAQEQTEGFMFAQHFVGEAVENKWTGAEIQDNLNKELKAIQDDRTGKLLDNILRSPVFGRSTPQTITINPNPRGKASDDVDSPDWQPPAVLGPVRPRDSGGTGPHGAVVEQRRTADGRVLTKFADGTIQ
jgi:hypothetical protein